MNNYEKNIKSIIKSDINISPNYYNMIDSTINSLPQKRKKDINYYKFKKTFAIACCFCFFISSIAFGKEIITFFKNYFFYNTGIDTAINNGYIDIPSKNIVNSDGTEININSLLMDDYNLSFSLNIQFQNDINVSNITRARIVDMIITDENNNILYCENKDVFDSFCEKNDLSYVFNNFSENYVNSSNNWYIKNKSIENNNFELIYNIFGNKFPNSKKLIIHFNQINYSKKEISENEENSIIGNWKISYDVPEKFYKREVITYTVTNCSNPNLIITDASLYNTNFKFSFKTQFKEWYDTNASEDEIKKAYTNFKNWKDKENQEGRKLIYNEYIITENNNKFYPLNSSTEDTLTQYNVNGNFTHYQTFNLTQFEQNVKKIKLYFTINLPYKNEDVVIELERKE